MHRCTPIHPPFLSSLSAQIHPDSVKLAFAGDAIDDSSSSPQDATPGQFAKTSSPKELPGVHFDSVVEVIARTLPLGDRPPGRGAVEKVR
jgi:hypothetical protein